MGKNNVKTTKINFSWKNKKNNMNIYAKNELCDIAL